MKLENVLGYSTRAITAVDSDELPMCELIIAKTNTGKIFQGAVFEAALKWNNYTLIFLTDGVPFEDALNIYLLDENLNVTDYARMYFMYSTGIFSDVDLTEADTVHFHFLGEKRWTLKLFNEGKFYIPILSGTLGVFRPFSFFRKFHLFAQPSSSPEPG